MASDSLVRFASFEIDLETRQLSRQGRRVRLQDLPFRVLVALVERPGEVVRREELKAMLWPHDAYGEFDVGINTAVRKLRQALDDSAENPRFIETLPRLGYRFLTPVAQSTNTPFAGTGAAVAAGKISSSLTHAAAAAPLRAAARPGRTVWLWIASLAAVALAIASLAFRNTGRMKRDGGAQRVQLLTTYPGVESSPSFSPGGSHVAFAWDGGRPGASDIYVKVIGEGKPLRVTTSASHEVKPSWSPDGRLIAFIRIDEIGRTGSVYVTSPLGGNERRIAQPAEDVSWTPDSKSLLMATPLESGYRVAIEEVRIDNGHRRRITHPAEDYMADRFGSVSPDGKTLAFARCAKADLCDIYVTGIPSGDTRRLTHDETPISGITWTADGQEIVFSSLRSGEPKLWRIRRSGRDAEPEAVAASEKGVGAPAVSRAAAGLPVRLAFEQTVGYTNISRTEILGPGANRRLGRAMPLLSSTQGENEPSYSPDGSRIAFMSKRSGRWHAWIADSNGDSAEPVPGLAGDLNWSPDGRWLAANCAEDPVEDELDICVAPADGGPVRRAIKSTNVETLPFWSRDGRWIYYVAGRAGSFSIWKTDMNGIAPTRVSADDTMGGWDSPDGRDVFFFKNLGTPGPKSARTLWRVPVEGGPETAVLDRAYPMFVTVAKEGIYFLDLARFPGQAADVLKLYRWKHRDTLTIGKLAKPVQRAPTALSVSPDGRYVLTVHFEVAGGDLMMIEDFQ